jgi:hypothetical protein
MAEAKGGGIELCGGDRGVHTRFCSLNFRFPRSLRPFFHFAGSRSVSER